MRRTVSHHRIPAGALAFAAVLAVWPAGSAAADAFDAGDIVIVDPADRTRPINEGDSNTIVTFRLPDDAVCGGDSRNDGWRVHSFLMPEGSDLTGMRYDDVHPVGSDFNLVMRTVAGGLFVHRFTDVNSVAGQEAFVGEIPALTFGFWDPQIFPPGTYHVGIACAPSSRIVERYWDATIVVTEDPAVEPWQRRWQVTDEFAADVPWEFPTRAVLIGVALAASAVTVALTVVGRRRRPPTADASPPESLDPSPPEHDGVSRRHEGALS